MSDDPRLNAARYRVDRDSRPDAMPAEDEGGVERGDAGAPTAEQRAAYVEIALQQAMRRGDFDDLPGAGRPLTGLTGRHDPDWWIRRKIETEGLGGLGPPALTLRVESQQLETRLDALGSERDVRAAIEDFNARVVEARRQLLGGPPVVTPTRDLEAEVAAWAARREARHRELAAQQDAARAAGRGARRLGRRRRSDHRTRGE
ncbi:MAG: DUF1992 domain-containing protein [Actinomycetales bacterium]|nr:DUF1992 domain-containing protein [Actinomycetales bacterium]